MQCSQDSDLGRQNTCSDPRFASLAWEVAVPVAVRHSPPPPAPAARGMRHSPKPVRPIHVGYVVYTWNTMYRWRMTQMPIESIRDVRAHLADVVERADRDDVPTVITRRGKQVAAVVSIGVLRKYQEWEEREINRIIDERMADPAPGVPIEDVMRETLARGE